MLMQQVSCEAQDVPLTVSHHSCTALWEDNCGRTRQISQISLREVLLHVHLSAVRNGLRLTPFHLPSFDGGRRGLLNDPGTRRRLREGFRRLWGALCAFCSLGPVLVLP